MKTTFYLVRHGQPDWDWAEAMRFYGPCSAYMPLTPLGVEQIEHTACDSQLRGASFILASPYTRTMQSAQILSRRLDLPVTVEWELHEWLYDRDMKGDLPTPEERFGREDMTRCFFYYMEHDELTGEEITPRISGYDDRKQRLIVKSRCTEQRRQPVDEGRHIGRKRIIIVWTEEQDRVSPLDRRVDIFHHGSAVEAFSLLTKVQAHLVWTSRTVHESAVSQVDLLNPDPFIQALLYFLPNRQGIGGPVV